jgi:hypothetical protein
MKDRPMNIAGEAHDLIRYIGAPSSQKLTPGINAAAATNHTRNLAYCYANGFGVGRNVITALECLNDIPGLYWIGPILYDDQKEPHKKADGDGDSFSRCIINYQKMIGRRYIDDTLYLKVAPHADSWQPQDLQDCLHAMTDVQFAQAHLVKVHLSQVHLAQIHLAHVQVVFKHDVYAHPWLHYAALTNNIPLAKDLCSRGYPIDTLDREERTALFEACTLGYEDMVYLILEHGADVNLVEDAGVSPLHLLVFFEPSVVHHVCSSMMARGARIHAATRRSVAWAFPWHGIQVIGAPLHFAVACRNVAVVETLLNFGADPNQRAGFIRPLDLAASFNLPEICTILIEHGATLSKDMFAGRTPLHYIGDSMCCSPIGKVCYLRHHLTKSPSNKSRR